jgi:hypothetical protein
LDISVKPARSRADMSKSQPNYQITDVVPFGTAHRLAPPESLSDRAREHFIDLVASVPSSHFKSSDLPLLCRWAEMSALAERCAFQMEQQHGIVSPDGRVTPWPGIHANCTKVLALLALRLRLGPQSRTRKAPKREAGPGPSYYEREAMRERGRHA